MIFDLRSLIFVSVADSLAGLADHAGERSREITHQSAKIEEGRSLYRSLLRPLLFRFPPETAHELALHSLPLFLKPKIIREQVRKKYDAAPFGRLERFGLAFSNPVGLAAGFDKNGIAIEAL